MNDMRYCMYLRKSRLDLEAEKQGSGDTLARHKKILQELAASRNHEIRTIYAEVVSGDSISARPEMQRLLSDVTAGMWTGVYTMEADRLARGDTSDQGTVAKAFKFSNTIILTPMKTYDPRIEADEEFFEFNLFMSRREYKIINRRLQRGRIASASDGNYVGGQVPYGYRKAWSGIYPTLEIDDQEAEIVRFIYQKYCNNETAYSIARQLNQMGVPSKKGGAWRQETLRGILSNPVYIGMIRWKNRIGVKTIENNTERHRVYGGDETIVVPGKHPAIIDNDTFQRAQTIMKARYMWPVNDRSTLKNPFAKIAKCGLCGHTLLRGIRRGKPFLFCSTYGCKNKSIQIDMFEADTLLSLSEWLENYKIETKMRQENSNDEKNLKGIVSRVDNEIAVLKKQKDALHDLLEQGVYDVETFKSRRVSIDERMADAETERENLINEIANLNEIRQRQLDVIPRVSNVIENYGNATTAESKNGLLRSVIEKIVYTHTEEEPSIVVYPRIPKNTDLASMDL